jgi:NAD(P)-dependent dehydrogenase (short-subunit alcohol dehydrogenase family)
LILRSVTDTNSRWAIHQDHSQNTYPFVDPTKVSHDGRYIFITGASKGVGTATAIAFAKAGAAGIALGARSDCSSVEAEILSAAETSGKKAPRILKIKLDVMDYTSVESAAKEIENTFPRLDILINNAAYLSTWLTIADSEPEEYWRNYEINLRGVYWVTKAILPILLREGEKTILNVSSRGAHAIHAGASGYQATKFALLRFTEYLMVENAEQGLLAYCVHPCSVKTVLASGIPEHLQHCEHFCPGVLRHWAD